MYVYALHITLFADLLISSTGLGPIIITVNNYVEFSFLIIFTISITIIFVIEKIIAKLFTNRYYPCIY